MRQLDQSRFPRGTWLTYAASSSDRLQALHRRVVAEIIDAAAQVRGPQSAGILQAGGLEMLHVAVDPLDVTSIRDRVLGRLRNDLLAAAVDVARSVMGWKDDFYVDDYLILRVNMPYEVAKNADPAAENPGIGRITPSVRELALSRKVKDPLYDPVAYHRGHPPAAWTHGPHLDSWSGHTRDGLNIWWAISDVPAGSGMVFYPETIGKPLICDRRTLYLQHGQQLSPPTFAPLAAGEMLIFDPEILHGTHLNVTPQTRVAISMRLNAREPTFDPACFYAREFWRLSSDIESNEFERILHLKREDHLDRPAALRAAPANPVRAIDVAYVAGETVVAIGPSALLPDGGRILAELPDRRVLLMRSGGRPHAIESACPHDGAELSDGGCDGRILYCPACAVGFDIETGRSAAPSLALKTFVSADADGTLRVDLAE